MKREQQYQADYYQRNRARLLERSRERRAARQADPARNSLGTEQAIGAMKDRSAITARFMSFVEVAPSGCWEWTGSRGGRASRYGQFSLNQVLLLAHRISFVLFVGSIPDGLFVCHGCNNPTCVNPKHLYAATNAQNIMDAYRDGLKVQPRRTHCSRGHAYDAENTHVVHDRRGGTWQQCRACRRKRPTN